ncbi:MAG: hypothetical protein EOM23_02215 [Candidatus Moranbacteria bacterium]|nr:hypothetical protein [Candidatus Moranbacteria bacterium]
MEKFYEQRKRKFAVFSAEGKLLRILETEPKGLIEICRKDSILANLSNALIFAFDGYLVKGTDTRGYVAAAKAFKRS